MTTYIYSSAIFFNVRNAIFLFLLVINQYSAFSQNLVPNPSFEMINSCPASLNNLQNAIGWITIYNTPDCFNRCATGSTSIPNNIVGFQEPFNLSDNSYAGLIPAGRDTGGYREMIGVVLSSALEIGKKYFFSFNYSSGFRDLPTSHCNCFTSHFGMKLLTSFSDTANLGISLINDNAILYSNLVFSDTLNWNLFEGSFIADSAYTCLILGNFFNFSNIVSTCQDSIKSYSYIYLDNVCLSPIINKCDGPNPSSGNNEFSIYPSIGNGVIKIESNFNNLFFQLEIYNYLGKLIRNVRAEGGELEINLQDISKGVYLLRIENFIYKIIII